MVQTSHSSVSNPNLHLPPQPFDQATMATAGTSQALVQTTSLINQTRSQPPPLPRPCANPGYYIITLLGYCHPSVSVCYGCQQPLKMNGQQTPPLDLVVLTQMRREYFNNGKRMSKMGNVYFHANMHCLRSRLPFFHPTLLQLQPGLHAFLLDAHKRELNFHFGLVL